MEENQEKNQGGGKGILIIIAIIIVAVAAYFVVKAVNKKGAENSPTVSISEADKLELNSLNLNGKWEKNAGTDKFELNFKSTKELVLTQYDGSGEVKVKSDEGAYSVDNGVLNLTVTANGEAITAAATAVLSEKYLIITVTDGNSIFAGTYTANRGDMPNVDNSSDVESAEGSDSSRIESSIENSGAQSVVSKTESTVSEIESIVSVPEVPKEIHISNLISPYLSMTLGQVLDSSETAPISKAIGTQITLNSYTVNVWNDAYNPDYGEKLLGFSCPIKMFFTNISANPTISDDVGKESYTYNELKEMLGDSLSYEFVQDGGEAAGYVLKATIDGYTVYFGDKLLSWYGVSSLDIPFTYCQIDARQQ